MKKKFRQVNSVLLDRNMFFFIVTVFKNRAVFE